MLALPSPYACGGLVFGPQRQAALAKRLPRLHERRERLSLRPALARAIASRPRGFTVRPDEPAALARLHAADLSPANF